MKDRSRWLRHVTCGLVASGFIALGLSLHPFIASSPGAQEPAPTTRDTVQKGQPSDRLEPDARLRVQRLKTRKARATYEIARLIREVAQIAAEEYGEETYPQELAAVEGEIKIAESDVSKARDRFDRATQKFKKGKGSERERLAEELNLEKANYTLESLQSKKKVLIKYTYRKTFKELESTVKKARKVETDKEAAWKREAARQTELEH